MTALRPRCTPGSALPGIAIALCLVFTGIADAAPRKVAHVDGLIGPRLIGDEVAWIDVKCTDCYLSDGVSPFGLFVADRSGRGPREQLVRSTAESSGGGSASRFERVDFDISEDVLAFQREQSISVFADGYDNSFLRFGARGERLPLVAKCTTSQIAVLGEETLPYAVDGERVLFVEGCDSDRRSVVLWDRRTSRRRTVAVVSDATRRFGSVALAGDFAGYRIRTRDRQSEMVVVRLNGAGGGYRVTVPPEVESDQIDLDAAGRLAVLTPNPEPRPRGCGDYGLSWYSPAEPFAHRLAVVEVCSQPIGWAGERIAYVGGPTVFAFGSKLRTVGLDSSERLAVDGGRIGLHSFDADGRGLAYGLSACDGGIDLLVLPSTERAPPRPASCPTRLLNRRVGVRGRRAGVKLACPRGCAGTIRILRGWPRGVQ